MAVKVCQLCAVDFTLKKFLLPLIDGMTAKGWRVTAVCSDGPYVGALRAGGYDVRTLAIARSMNALAHLRSLLRLVRLFRAERFDVVHVHTPVAALLGRVAARIARVPLVVYTAHGFYFHDEMPRWRRRLFVGLERLAGFLTDFLFTQSVEDAAAAVRHRFMAEDRILAIGNGVNPERFDPLRVDGAKVRHELGIPDDAPVVGIVARLVQEKGYVEFLQAIARAGDRFPGAFFLVVGERLASDHSGAIDDHLRVATQRLGRRMVLTGMREDIPELLAAMDVFCLPSHREGMPRTIIEAMMMGRPVVATDIRGSREEVVDGATGFLVPTRHPEALGDALCKLLASRDIRRQMGAAGRERALRLFDERNVVTVQLRTIGSLLAQHTRGARPRGAD